MLGSLVLIREDMGVLRSERLMVVFETAPEKAIGIAEAQARLDSAGRTPAREGGAIKGHFVYGATADIIERHVQHGLSQGNAIGWRDK